jgi:pSer/pThr/pTyr-binding forkhead associated (FHA) protein
MTRVDSAWIVYDLGSANGTRVNSVNVTEKGKVLADGDVLTLGQTMIQFRTN